MCQRGNPRAFVLLLVEREAVEACAQLVDRLLDGATPFGQAIERVQLRRQLGGCLRDMRRGPGTPLVIGHARGERRSVDDGESALRVVEQTRRGEHGAGEGYVAERVAAPAAPAPRWAPRGARGTWPPPATRAGRVRAAPRRPRRRRRVPSRRRRGSCRRASRPPRRPLP